MKLKPVMFVGTCSDAGKSVINTAFCRIFLQDGYKPAPFKAQNMSLNSYSTPEGGEIGRAQAVQAEACRIEPHTDMNPVLLKPIGEQGSQVIVNGVPVGNRTASDYFRSGKAELFREAFAAFRRLEARYNPVVLEGAGSVSELNLRGRDITNMQMALAAGAATFLVADIERGGVFASVYGSIRLLLPEERALIKGILINKFRGDTALFEEGKRLLEELTGVPVVGVIPYYRHIRIEEEDSLALQMKPSEREEGKINVAVVALEHLSNYTDFDALEQDGRFHVYYTYEAAELEEADIVILPGSKNTIGDLQMLQQDGRAAAIVNAYKAGKKVIGICGGYQMLGLRIEDPERIEGEMKMLSGLGLLPQQTVITPEKQVRQRKFRFGGKGKECRGYEIHMGRTVTQAGNPDYPLNILEDGSREGYRLNERCWGTYLHGILDNTVVRDELAGGWACQARRGTEYFSFKEQQYDLLAAHVRAAVDMDYVYSVLRTENE